MPEEKSLEEKVEEVAPAVEDVAVEAPEPAKKTTRKRSTTKKSTAPKKVVEAPIVEEEIKPAPAKQEKPRKSRQGNRHRG